MPPIVSCSNGRICEAKRKQKVRKTVQKWHGKLQNIRKMSNDLNRKKTTKHSEIEEKEEEAASPVEEQ